MVVGNHLQSLSCKHRFAWRREQESIHKTMWSHLIIALNSLRKTGQHYHIFRTAGHKSRRGHESIFSCGVKLSLVAEKWKQLVFVSEDLLMSAMCVRSGFHVYNAVRSTQWWWKKNNITIYSVESGAALHNLQSDRSGHKWAFCKKQQKTLGTIHIKTSN